jgi:predicted permease
VDVQSLREFMVGEVRPLIYALFFAGLLVLLVACGAVINLALVRMEVRHRELSVRRALGAGSRRLLWESALEGSLLALAGGLVALGLAMLLVQYLGVVGPTKIPRFEFLALGWVEVAFTLATALGTGLLCSLIPVARALRTVPALGLCSGNLGGERSLRAAVVTTVVALTVVLLVALGLLLRSVLELEQTSLGFQHRDVLAAYLSLPAARYPNAEDRINFYESLLTNLRRRPEVRSAGAVQGLPLTGAQGDLDLDFEIVGRPRSPDGPLPRASARIATPEYFSTLGIRLLEGRFFGDEGRTEGSPELLINRTLARRHWPQGGALGAELEIQLRGGLQCRVVGIVEDTRDDGLDQQAKPVFYWPFHRMPSPTMAVVVRGEASTVQLTEMVREVIRQMDPQQPIYRLITMQGLVDRSLAERRFQLYLSIVFGVLAWFLAMAGIYALLSEVVQTQRRALGVRMALGADAAAVRRSVLRPALTWTGLGIAVGLLLAPAVGRGLQSLPYGVSTSDPLILASASLALLVAAFLGSYFPARRAIRIDPVRILKEG